jgi:hypothetical protein
MERRLVLCVGPHRSGTSVTAAALQALGAELRLPRLHANFENPKGFYEHSGVVVLNEEILADLGGSWDTPTFDGRAALASGSAGRARVEQWIERAAELIRRILGDASLAAVKDPRICILAPIWIEAAARAGVAGENLVFVHSYRDPVEAALSQRTRTAKDPEAYEFGRTLTEGASLWLSYTGQLFEAAEGHRITIVPHHALFEDPLAVLVRLAGVLGAEADPDRIAGFARSFVDDGLYRSRPAPADREAVRAALPPIAEVVGLLEAAAAAPTVPEETRRRIAGLWRDPACQEAIARAALPALGRLSRKAREGSRAVAELRAYVEQQQKAQAEELARQRAARERALAELEAERSAAQASLQAMAEAAAAQERTIARLEGEKAALVAAREELLAWRGEILASTSWRITAPLRALRGVLR